MTEDNIRVLLVDDEPDFLRTLSKRLSLRKLHVLTADSGEQALKVLDAEGVDVVVLDVKMPGMDGIATIRAIKDKNPLVEVIMLTGHANLEASLEGMELGAFDYLLKPAEVDQLLYKIQDAYQKKSLQQAKIKALKDAVRTSEPS